MNPLRRWLPVLLVIGLNGCAGFIAGDPPQVHVVGLEPLSGQGLELRMLVKLRVINPNETPIEYDGVFLDMDVQGKNFATGVSDTRGTIPRFSESVLSVPVTVSAMAVLRQAVSAAQGNAARVPYSVSGKLAGSQLRTVRFTTEGEFKLPAGLSR